MSRKESSASEKNNNKKASYPLTALALTLFFGLSFFYMELVFKFSVSALKADVSLVRMFAISFITGGFIAFLVYMLPTVLARITAALALLVSTVSFLIEFFIQREFSVFYDINTILNAATDALKGFAGDIKELIFCFDGISHILLFIVPLVLWIIFGRKLVKGIRRTRMIEMSYPVPDKDKGIARMRMTKKLPRLWSSPAEDLFPTEEDALLRDLSLREFSALQSPHFSSCPIRV